MNIKYIYTIMHPSGLTFSDQNSLITNKCVKWKNGLEVILLLGGARL